MPNAFYMSLYVKERKENASISTGEGNEKNVNDWASCPWEWIRKGGVLHVSHSWIVNLIRGEKYIIFPEIYKLFLQENNKGKVLLGIYHTPPWGNVMLRRLGMSRREKIAKVLVL